MAFSANANMMAPVLRSLLVNGSRACLRPATMAYYNGSANLCNINAIIASRNPSFKQEVFSHPIQNIHTTPFRYDEAKLIPLPALSPTMESGSIVSWDKSEGDQLNEGDLLAEIETDKATMAFETPEEGYLAKILVPAGTKGVPLGKPLCIIVETEEEAAKFKNMSIEEALASSGGSSSGSAAQSQPESQSSPPPQASQPAQAPMTPAPSAPAPQQPQQQFVQQQVSQPAGDRIMASPLAKRLAREMGVQLPQSGSGPHGRVVAEDLKGAPVSPSQAMPAMPMASTEDYIDIPLTNMRQTIAKRLTLSKQSIPHYYLTVNLKIDELLQLRERVNAMLAKDNVKLSVNDFIVKAAALACKQVPQVNSMWQETFIRQFNRVDVSVAVSTDSGLITPIVFNAENKGIQQIGTEIKSLAEKARSGRLQPHEFQGGTFTISNLGMFEISHFTAVINPPQSAILAVGSTQQTVVPSESGEEKFKLTNTLNVTLSCDHRVVDGAVGAQWLKSFRRYMEKPFTMLL